MAVVKRGRALLANLVLRVAMFYDDVFEAFVQEPDNGLDAEATVIRVILEPNGRVTVIDNGHGMVPAMLAPDKAIVDDHFDKAEQGKLTPDDDVYAKVPETSVSRKSLEWMMECIGFSPKEGSKKTRGRHGVGALGYLYYAKKKEVISKPRLDLARAFWGDNLTEAENAAVWLEGFIEETLQTGVATYNVDLSKRELFDHLGKPMAHGTRVELSGIEEDNELFNVTKLIGSLRTKFGENIRQGQIRVYVHDRRSPEALASAKGEVVHEVRPTEYRGYQVLDQDFFCDSVRFRVKLWYDPRGRDLVPKIEFMGAETKSLTDETEFQDIPWNSGQLAGTIGIPMFNNINSLLDGAKKTLRASDARNRWIRVIKGKVEPEVQKFIDSWKEKIEAENFRELTEDLTQSLQDAMADDPDFRHHVVLTNTTSTPTGITRGPRGPRTFEGIEVVVYNEHNDGVADVKVRISQNRKVSEERTTGVSGILAFGGVSGRWLVELILPPEVQADGDISQIVNVTPNNPGPRVVFKVTNGEPKRETAKVSGLKLEWRGDPAIQKPYLSFLRERGSIEINTLYPAWVEAVNEGEERKLALLAQYCSSAMTEYCLTGDKEFLFHRCSNLFAKVHTYLCRRQASRKRQHRQGSRKQSA